MSSLALTSRRRRLALSVGAALAAALVASPAAHAQFTLAECQGALAPGQGATFQNNAFNGFKAVFGQETPTGCGASAANFVTWTGTGSGAGRIALGQTDNATNPRSVRDPAFRWAGADEPPNPTQRGQMEAGPTDANNVDVTTADNNALHVIPVAIGAIAALVHLPDGCTGFGATTPLYGQRPKVTLEALENVWYGTGTTWADLLPTLPVAGCGDQPIKRIVRTDSSGSTFAFKQLLANIAPAHAAEWRALNNQLWPTDGTAIRPTATGGGALASYVGLAANPGTIGYVDLATARTNSNFTFTYVDGTFDKTFWLPLQRTKGNPDLYDDPQLDANGYKKDAPARGANCGGVKVNKIPATPTDATLGNWSVTDATLTGTGYAACTLTYEMAFDDNAVAYCNSPEEQAKARTIKDYFTKAIISSAGQDSLLKNDYDALPGGIYALAKTGVDAIGWNKGGRGRPCDGAQPQPQPTVTPTPGGNTPVVTPPPAAISNAVTLASSRVSGTTIRLSLQLPGAGKLSIASSTKPAKGKAIKLTTKNVTVTKSGAQTITVSLSSKAKKALKKDKKLKVTLKITYTPTGGKAKTITKSVTVKQAKKP
jgi:ABC-type phosphate transport system substrate-binding protein